MYINTYHACIYVYLYSYFTCQCVVGVMNGCSENDITAYENWDDLSSDDMDSGVMIMHNISRSFISF
jgi:hypothetical protein